jgi:hypothetical protein
VDKKAFNGINEKDREVAIAVLAAPPTAEPVNKNKILLSPSYLRLLR